MWVRGFDVLKIFLIICWVLALNDGIITIIYPGVLLAIFIGNNNFLVTNVDCYTFLTTTGINVFYGGLLVLILVIEKILKRRRKR